MTELSGFSAVEKVIADIGPQALQVPADKADAIARAAQIIEGLWGAAEAGLSRNIRIEILTPDDGVTRMIIAPLQPNAIDRPVANPGDWIAVDGMRLTPMQPDSFATQFAMKVAAPAEKGVL